MYYQIDYMFNMHVDVSMTLKRKSLNKGGITIQLP